MKTHHTISVRPAVPGDLEQTYALELSCSRNPWSRNSLAVELSSPDHVSLVLETPDGLIVGFACALLAADELQILEVIVHRDCRKAGLGTLLITRLAAVAESKGALRAFLEVRVTNTPAINLYKKCGFAHDGVREGYYQDGEDAVLMSMAISA